MTNVRCVIVKFFLLLFIAVAVNGCRTVFYEPYRPAMDSVSEHVYLGSVRDTMREVLTDTEHKVVLSILNGVIIRKKVPRGVSEYIPLPGKYWLSLRSSNGERHFYFKADGSLLFGNLPKEKVEELARVITGVAKRMPPAPPLEEW